MRAAAIAPFTIPLVFALACSSTHAEPAAAPPDVDVDAAAATPDPPDTADGGVDAAINTNYPAFPFDTPQLVSAGGKVLVAPKLQLLFFPGDTMAPALTTFVSTLGASSYWSGATKEYGVGPTTALPAVTLTEAAPATIDDTNIKTWLASELDGSHPEIPAPDGQTVYIIVYPESTVVTVESSTSCVDLGGYHSEATLGAGGSTPYIVLPRCAKFANQTGENAVTFTLSHEIVEASLDPFIASKPAYDLIDIAHAAWIATGQLEPGDVCFQDSARPADFDFLVQRTWSNAAAKAGHDPCVPSGTTPYFAATPIVPDQTLINAAKVPALTLAVGQSKTIDVQLASDGPMDDWEVGAYDSASSFEHGLPQLTFAMPVTKGRNGDVLSLTVTAARAGRTGPFMGISSFVVVSRTANGRANMTAALVANE